MNRTSTRTSKTSAARILGVSAVALASLGLAACSGSSGSATTSGSSAQSSAGSSSSPSMTPSMSASPMADMTQFGSACASVPKDGAGSFAGMAKDPVATAASNNPALSTLVTAVTAAGLGDTLNSAQDITVFAPANDGFAKIPKATLDGVLADPKGALTDILTYHVVSGKLTPAQLAGTHKTLEGKNLTVAGSGENFTVNGGAKVVCGNVQTANATVYILDSVLMPPAA